MLKFPLIIPENKLMTTLFKYASVKILIFIFIVYGDYKNEKVLGGMNITSPTISIVFLLFATTIPYCES